MRGINFFEESAAIDFLLERCLPEGLAFSRASAGTRSNKSRLIVTETLDVPRFDYSLSTGAPLGLLIEASRQNGVLYSIPTAKTWTWLNGATITDSAAVALDGTMSMACLSEDNSLGLHSVDAQNYTEYKAGMPYAWSIFAKAGTATALQIFTAQTAGSRYVNFDLLSGKVAASSGLKGTMQDVGNGIYRCVAVDLSFAASGYNPTIKIALINNNPNLQCAPDHGYPGAGRGVYLWGAQMEQGSTFASSYIPTEGAAAARAADRLSFTVPRGVSALRYLFDDGSTQIMPVSAGLYTVPASLKRACIKRITSL